MNSFSGSVCLGCEELSEDHTGNDPADALQLLMSNYNLSIPSNNVWSFTTDCGANILKTTINLGVQVPCFGHDFNTAVGNVFKLLRHTLYN